jgi:hypothetical protein
MAYLFGQICGLTKAHVPHRANVEQAVAHLQYSKSGRCYAYIHLFGLKLADPKLLTVHATSLLVVALRYARTAKGSLLGIQSFVWKLADPKTLMMYTTSFIFVALQCHGKTFLPAMLRTWPC